MDIKGLIGDIEKAVELNKRLKEAGIIGIENGIHLTTEAFFRNFDDGYVEAYSNERYFWKAAIVYRGLTFFTLLGLEEVAEFNIDVFKTKEA